MTHHDDTVLLGNIRRILDEKGIKYCKMASALGLSSAEFSRMLSGKRIARTRYIPTIAGILGVTPNDLFADAEKTA